MSGAIIRFLISIILRIGDIANSDKMILRIYKAYPVVQGEFSMIQEKLNALSNRAGIKPPSLYITELHLPGSFIFGKKPNETIMVFPKRLLDIMKPDHIEAMLAYSLVQINDNIRIRTLVALVTSFMTLSSSAIRWVTVFTGFGDYNDPAPKLFGLFIMGLVAPPAATMVQSVTKPDYDGKAAAMCGSPDSLISAIEILENNNVTGYPSLGFVCLIDPKAETFFEQLFQTHPSRDVRMKNLFAKGEKT